MSYPASAVLSALSTEPLLSGAATEKQRAWWRNSIRAVETFTGQKFTAEEDLALTIDGGDTQRLVLPRRLAVLDALSVAEPVGSSLAVGDVALTGDHDALIVKPTAFTGASWVEKLMRQGQPPRFPSGYGTVIVTGTWGWTDAELPAAAPVSGDPSSLLDANPVAAAILLDMEDQARTDSYGLANTARAYSRLGVSGATEGPLGVTMAPVRPEVGLPVEAQEALLDYIWAPVAVP